jgi:hypothetical protein
MFEVKEFALQSDRKPTLVDIETCVKKANENNCVVKLTWFIKWNGWHNIMIYPGEDPNEIYESLPRVYGV